MQESGFYRALISKDHLDRWTQGNFTSFHHKVPGEWLKIWSEKGSQDQIDYPLRCREGVFTEQARQAFISDVPNRPLNKRWPDDVLCKVSELDGVCAFRFARDAYDYGITSHLKSRALFVEFTGEFVCQAPEENGVIVRVIKPVHTPYSAEEFKRKHKLT